MSSGGATTAGVGAGAGTGGSQGQAQPGFGQASGWTADMENAALSQYILIICGALSIALIFWRLSYVVTRLLRLVAGLQNDSQRYFAIPSSTMSRFKKYIWYSPIGSKRHNREFALSSAVNMGTLPTRLQLLFLVGYLATNVAFCVVDIPFGSSLKDVTSQLRNRTGNLAVVNMIPLFIMAGRNNPLIKWLGMSFDTFNLLHRWFGRIVALEALCHTLAYIVGSTAKGSLSETFAAIAHSPFMLWGLIATIAFLVITVQASSISRHAFYESFKILHIMLAAVAVAGVWYHMEIKHYPQIKYVVPVIVVWILDRATRIFRVLWNNIGSGGTRTLVEAMPGDTCRVTVSMARPWNFKAGQHAYLYMPTISFWQSHPFSVAWSEEAQDVSDDKLAMNRQDVLAMRKTSMSFIIRARTGMTRTLYQRAAAQPDGKLSIRCLVEGPYGALHHMDSYGTAMLFAGGVGITHQVPNVRHLVSGYANGTVATKKIVLVWIIQSPEHLEWIRPWMTEILAMDKRRDCLRILLFVSRPRTTKEIQSPSSTVQMFPGRPNVETLIGMEMDQQVGALGVSVCGPGALSDEVRQAVRARQFDGVVDFIDEAFTW